MGRVVFRPFGRQFSIFFVIVALSAMLLAGCETGSDSFSSRGQSSDGRGLAGGGFSGGSTPQFSSVAGISFMPAPDSPRAQAIRAQTTDNPAGLRQLLHGVTDLPLNYTSVEEKDGLPVFYTPTRDPHGTLGGIWDVQGYVQGLGGLGEGAAIEYTWTLPPDPSGLPTLLFFNQDGLHGILGELTAAGSDYHVVEGDTVVLRLEIQSDGTWTGSINGQDLPPEATSEVHGNQIGQPVFYSRRHGVHSVTTEVFSSELFFIPGTPDGSSTKSFSYFQRGLIFTEPFPETDPNNKQEPILIENSVAWSDDSPLSDDEVQWAVRGPENSTFGASKEISTTWTPVDRILTRLEDDEEDLEVTEFEALSLEITAETEVYEEKEAFGYPSFQYRIQHSLDALGAREFRIIGAEILPEEPFTEEEPFAEFNAEICLIGPDPADYDVTWVVEIKNPEGEIVVPELQMGEGYQVYAFWDGTVGGESVDEPETYQFHVRVEACSSDGGGGAFRAIRTQETTSPECLGEVAKLDDPIGLEAEIRVFGKPRNQLVASSVKDEAEELLDIVFLGPDNEQPGSQDSREVGLEVETEAGLSQIEVSVRNLHSNDIDRTLTLQEVGNEGKYEADVDLAQFLDASKTSIFAIELSDKGSLGVLTEKSDTLEATRLLEQFDAYAQGLVVKNSDLAAEIEDDEDLDEVSALANNVRSGGYQVLSLKVNGTSSRAFVRVKSSADIIYYSGHGQHAGATIQPVIAESGDEAVLVPFDNLNSIPRALGTAALLGRLDWSNTQVAIFAGCSAFDLNDYTHEFDERRSEARGFEPALAWRERLNGGSGSLQVGYRHFAPLGPKYDTEIIRSFLLSSGMFYPSWPENWLDANLLHSSNDSACVLDFEGNYWLIDYERKARRSLTYQVAPPPQIWATNRRKVYIPRDNFQLADPVSGSSETRLGWSAGRETRDQHHRFQVGPFLKDPVLILQDPE